jgi:hypothetical protein
MMPALQCSRRFNPASSTFRYHRVTKMPALVDRQDEDCIPSLKSTRPLQTGVTAAGGTD